MSYSYENFRFNQRKRYLRKIGVSCTITLYMDGAIENT